MSRKNKFRVWSEDTKSYHDCDNWLVKNLLIPTERSGNIIEQYTGLKDRNGKEIYEGDIIETDNFFFTVSYDKKRAMFVGICSINNRATGLYKLVSGKIVGNEHDK